MITEDAVRNALRAVKYPGYSRDIVSFGLVKHIAVTGKAVSVSLSLTSASPEAARQLRSDIEQVLKDLPGLEQVQVEVSQPQAAPGCGRSQSLDATGENAGDNPDRGSGQRQRRGGQINRGGQSSLRFAAFGPDSGFIGLRHLRPFDTAHDGRP